VSKPRETFAVNDRINSPLFGLGIISQVGEQYTTIAFDEGGTKRFLTSIVRLEHSDSPAPVKPERPTRASSKK
jgi:hypothetical protein